MELFMPKRVLFEEEALHYPLGELIYDRMNSLGKPVQIIASHNRVTGIPGANPTQSYLEAKKTLVVGVKRDLRFTSCKPSADLEFSLGTSCPGGCQYCYLQTHLGKKPYIRIYVNLEEILNQVKKIAEAGSPNITTFEASSTSDPLAVEHITGSLGRTIEFFGQLPYANLRVVSKFTTVDSLLSLHHNNRTRFRFSLNTPEIIRRFEHNTASLDERIAAAKKMDQAGYPLGFIIAPLFIYPGYEDGYTELFRHLALSMETNPQNLTFELITHRFTGSAKKIIMERFPKNTLDLEEANRRRKYGKYGLIKYIYREEEYNRLKEIILNLAKQFFPSSRVEYFT